MTIVPEGTPGAGVVALKRVDEMGFYNLSHKNLEEKLAWASIQSPRPSPSWDSRTSLNARNSSNEAAKVQRYSPKALSQIKALFEQKDEAKVRTEYREILKNR